MTVEVCRLMAGMTNAAAPEVAMLISDSVLFKLVCFSGRGYCQDLELVTVRSEYGVIPRFGI